MLLQVRKYGLAQLNFFSNDQTKLQVLQRLITTIKTSYPHPYHAFYFCQLQLVIFFINNYQFSDIIFSHSIFHAISIWYEIKTKETKVLEIFPEGWTNI